MTVRLLNDTTIALEGSCPLEDAEHLLRHLLEQPASAVDWHACDNAHTAVVQILMASGARLVGPPRGSYLARFIAPLIDRGEA